MREIEEMSVTEFRYWIAFDHVEPIGMERLDLIASTICAYIDNAFASSKTSQRTRPIDRMPDWWGTLKKEREGFRRQSPEEIMMRLNAWMTLNPGYLTPCHS